MIQLTTLIILILLISTWGQQLTIDNRSQRSLTFRLSIANKSINLPLQVAGINYNPQIDTGSSDFMIKGEGTAGIPTVKYSCPGCVSRNARYNISYMVGSAQTYEQSIPITFGGRTFNTSVLVAFIEKDMESDEGIIGLSYQSFANNPNPTFIQTLINIQMIDSYSYGVNLNLKSSTASYITLGSYDPRFFIGNLIYFPFSQPDQCNIKVDSVSFGSGRPLGIDEASLDTGTSALNFNSREYDNILSSFNTQFNECFFYKPQGEEYENLYCQVGRFRDLPKLRVVIDGNTFELEKEAYLDSCQRNPEEQFKDLNVNTGNWYCSLMIEIGPETMFVLGDAFFNRYYAYFDLENNRAGLARNYEKYTLSMSVNEDQFDWDVWDEFFNNQDN